MNLTPEHVQSKKKVGKIGENPVFEIATTGGFHMIVAARGGVFETLGTGPHRAVARHIAKKMEDKIVWTDLQKSDHVEYEHFAFCLPHYEAQTARIRALQGF